MISIDDNICPICNGSTLSHKSYGFPGPPEYFEYKCNDFMCGFTIGFRPDKQSKVDDMINNYLNKTHKEVVE